jgi:hypothetical protein
VEVRTNRVQDKTNIFFVAPRHTTLKAIVRNTVTGESWQVALNKEDPVVVGDFPIFGNGNRYSVELQGYSDVIKGIRLPSNHHWAYYLTFEEVTVPMPETPTPPPTGIPAHVAFAFQRMEAEQLRITPTFALPSAILGYNQQQGDNRKGVDFVTNELRFTEGGKQWVALGGQNPVTQDKVMAIAVDGQWGAIELWGKKFTTGAITKISPTAAPVTEPPVLFEREVKLAVPYLSQLDPNNAKYGIGDCGPTSGAMVLNFKGVPATPDRLGLIMGLPANYLASDILALEDGINKLAGRQLVDHRNAGTDPLTLITIIDGGNPAILLVDYDLIPYRSDANYHNGHYLVLVGYRYRKGKLEFLFHDPYWAVDRVDGQYMWMDVPALYACWGSTTYFNYPRQYLRVVG